MHSSHFHQSCCSLLIQRWLTTVVLFFFSLLASMALDSIPTPRSLDRRSDVGVQQPCAVSAPFSPLPIFLSLRCLSLHQPPTLPTTIFSSTSSAPTLVQAPDSSSIPSPSSQPPTPSPDRRSSSPSPRYTRHRRANLVTFLHQCSTSHACSCSP